MALPAEFHELAARVNNWKRWGPEDEIGTLNLITPEAVRRGAAAIKTGKRFSLALPLTSKGPQTGAVPGRSNPIRTMIALNRPLSRDPAGARSSDDVVFMGLQAATHWDALAHVTYDGRMYNGFEPDSIDERGAQRCGVDKVGTLVSRGVLLDVARALGVERLSGGYAITPDDLDAAVEQARVAIEPGDVVLVRTGQMQVLKEGRLVDYGTPSAGLGMATAAWFHERDVAAVATDNLTFEVYPGERDDVAFPLHMLHLVEMGLTQGQNFDLEDVAEACAADGVYTFLLDASPLPFVRALGSPVVPVAVK